MAQNRKMPKLRVSIYFSQFLTNFNLRIFVARRICSGIGGFLLIPKPSPGRKESGGSIKNRHIILYSSYEP